MSPSRYLTGSLDNMQWYVDLMCDELNRADVWGVYRAVADQAIGGARQLVNRTADVASQGSRWEVMRTFVDVGLEGAQDVVRTMAEEQARINMLAIQARMMDGTLSYMRRQSVLTVEALRGAEGLMTTLEAARPGAMTRVEIEPEGFTRAGEVRVTPR